MTNAYQNFLDFFSMHNKERLDGLAESYFTAMTGQERDLAFNYLLKLVETGGTEESVHGLFRANSDRAARAIRPLLSSGALRGEAQIAAAWNLWRIQPDQELLQIFFRFMADADERLREKSVYYVPSLRLTSELRSKLQEMIRTETELLTRIHAVDKLLEGSGVSKDSVGQAKYSSIYKGLHSDEPAVKEAAFKELDAIARPDEA